MRAPAPAYVRGVTPASTKIHHAGALMSSVTRPKEGTWPFRSAARGTPSWLNYNGWALQDFDGTPGARTAFRGFQGRRVPRRPSGAVGLHQCRTYPRLLAGRAPGGARRAVRSDTSPSTDRPSTTTDGPALVEPRQPPARPAAPAPGPGPLPPYGERRTATALLLVTTAGSRGDTRRATAAVGCAAEDGRLSVCGQHHHDLGTGSQPTPCRGRPHAAFAAPDGSGRTRTPLVRTQPSSPQRQHETSSGASG